MSLLDQHDSSDYRGRVVAIGFGFGLLLLGLLIRVYYLQVVRGDFYRAFSDRNRLKEIRIRAPRGLITDRNGVILADQKPSFDVVVTRGLLKDFEKTLTTLQAHLHLTDEEIEKKRRELKAHPRYREYLFKQDIAWKELSQLESLGGELPGIFIDLVPVRDYRFGDLFFHTIGYIGALSKREFEERAKKQPRRYFLQDYIGKRGLERAFEDQLKGSDGRDLRVVNARGEPVSTGGITLIPEHLRETVKAGNALITTLDARLQQGAREAFGDKQGAAVVMDVHNGDLLAILSRPSIDPHPFTRGISRAEMNAILESPYHPFVDKAVQEHYPPGSIYKFILAIAALSQGLDPEREFYTCPGSFRMGRGTWYCWERGGHGRVNLHAALVRSCDVYFYNVGLWLGLDAMAHFARGFGLGSKTGVGINNEIPGFVPTTEWFNRTVRDSSLTGETINASIGQGSVLVTPIQMAVATAALANGGAVMKPRLVRYISAPDGTIVRSFDPEVVRRIAIHPDHQARVIRDLTGVVNEPGGTAYWTARLPNVMIAGKTGTAQVASLPANIQTQAEREWFLQHHAWFVALAPADNPQIAVSVIVEHGGSGSKAAAPVARDIIRTYMTSPVATQTVSPRFAQAIP